MFWLNTWSWRSLRSSSQASWFCTPWRFHVPPVGFCRPGYAQVHQRTCRTIWCCPRIPLKQGNYECRRAWRWSCGLMSPMLCASGGTRWSCSTSQSVWTSPPRWGFLGVFAPKRHLSFQPRVIIAQAENYFCGQPICQSGDTRLIR